MLYKSLRGNCKSKSLIIILSQVSQRFLANLQNLPKQNSSSYHRKDMYLQMSIVCKIFSASEHKLRDGNIYLRCQCMLSVWTRKGHKHIQRYIIHCILSKHRQNFARSSEALSSTSLYDELTTRCSHT